MLSQVYALRNYIIKTIFQLLHSILVQVLVTLILVTVLWVTIVLVTLVFVPLITIIVLFVMAGFFGVIVNLLKLEDLINFQRHNSNYPYLLANLVAQLIIFLSLKIKP